jgi:hypothetical protein
VPPIRGLQWLGAEDEDMIGRHQVGRVSVWGQDVA